MSEFINPDDIFKIEAETPSGIELQKPMPMSGRKETDIHHSHAEYKHSEIDIPSMMVIQQMITNMFT